MIHQNVIPENNLVHCNKAQSMVWDCFSCQAVCARGTVTKGCYRATCHGKNCD